MCQMRENTGRLRLETTEARVEQKCLSLQMQESAGLRPLFPKCRKNLLYLCKHFVVFHEYRTSQVRSIKTSYLAKGHSKIKTRNILDGD
jgi:hypothetical protein